MTAVTALLSIYLEEDIRRDSWAPTKMSAKTLKSEEWKHWGMLFK